MILLFRTAPIEALAAWARAIPDRPRILLVQEGFAVEDGDWFEERLVVPAGPVRPDRWAAVLPAIRRLGARVAAIPMRDGGHSYREVAATALAAGAAEVRTRDPDGRVAEWKAAALREALARPASPPASVEPPPGTEVAFLAETGFEAPLIETRVFRYLEPIARAGRRVLLVTPEPTGLDGRMLRPAAIAERAASLPERLTWRPVPIRGSAERSLLRAAWRLPGRVPLVHARAHPSLRAVDRLARVFGRERVRWIADPRGLWPAEAVAAGVSVPGSRRAAFIERAFWSALGRSAAVLSIGEAFSRIVRARLPGIPMETVRNAADPSRIKFVVGEDRAILRRLWGLPAGMIFTHLGGTARYQALDAALASVSTARAAGMPAWLLILAHHGFEEAVAAVHRAALGDAVISMRLRPDEVGDRLAAADVGFVLRTADPGLEACFPTKAAEFLAAGVPLVYSDHIAEVAAIAPPPVGTPAPMGAPVPIESLRRAAAAAGDEAIRRAAHAAAEALWKTDGPEALDRMYDGMIR